MAIQFQCPGCQAVIRVPDAAAGKQGSCPRCNEKLLVPNVAGAAPAAQATAKVAPPASSRPAQLELPRLDPGPTAGLPKLEPLDNGRLPDVTAPAPVSTSTPSLGLPKLDAGSSIAADLQKKSQAKRKQGRGAWIVPLLCVVGVVGFLGWYLWTSQPKLEGALVAHTVHDLEVKPALIPGALSGLKDADLSEVLRHLKAEPAHWASTTSKITLTGTDDGVEASIRNGSASHFVSVAPGQSPALVDYLKQHFDELEKARLASIQKHAPSLFTAWKRHFTKNEPITNQKTLRDLVVLPTLVSGLGYHVEAIINGNVYPCVYEDSDAGELYFLLPNAAKSFVVQGRKVAGGVSVPAKFTVKLAGSVTAPAGRKPSKRKTAAERESDNSGMNPDLYKLDLDETAQNAGDALKSGLGDMLSDKKPTSPTAKSKSTTKKKPTLMDDEEMPADEMPAKSLPKRKPGKKKPVTAD